MKKTMVTLYSIVVLPAIWSLLFVGKEALKPVFGFAGTVIAQEKGLAKVIFKVKCYDEGKAALLGMKGIQRIETGFHSLDETDTVYFDPAVVTIEEMEAALKRAGTYVETIHEKERN